MRLIYILCFLAMPFLTSAQKYGAQMKDTVYENVDQPPSFPNGDMEMYDYIEENLWLNAQPYQLDRLELNGYYAILKFIVNDDGIIHGVTTDNRSRDFYLQDILEEIFLDMPRWEPGKVDGKPVNTLVYLELEMWVENGSLETRFHPLFPDSLDWTKGKLTKKQKIWGVIAAVALTGLFLLLSSGTLSN